MMRSARARTSAPGLQRRGDLRDATRAKSMPTHGQSLGRQTRGDARASQLGSRPGARVPGRRGADGVEQDLDGRALGHDRVGLGDRGRHGEHLVHVRAVEHDAGRVGPLLDAKAGAEPVAVAQRVVQDHDVRTRVSSAAGHLALARRRRPGSGSRAPARAGRAGRRAAPGGRRRRARGSGRHHVPRVAAPGMAHRMGNAARSRLRTGPASTARSARGGSRSASARRGRASRASRGCSRGGGRRSCG